jgi:hypothetical protein
MKFRADISQCENGRDTILSVCQSGPYGIEHEVIIQRSPREYEVFEDFPGPKISCDELGLDIVQGPESIDFSGGYMTIVLSDHEDIEVNISKLSKKEQVDLRVVAKALFE